MGNDELSSLLTEVVRNQKKNYKSLVNVFVITIIAYTTLLAFMVCGFIVYESQFEYETQTVETVSYEEEYEQEVSGDNSTINNVKGNQYNDNAVHNEGN